MKASSSAVLSEVAKIVQGGRLKLSGNDFVDDGFPAYGAGGMNGYVSHAEFQIPAVILSSIGARCGKCFLADGKWTSLANTQLIFPDPLVADARFLWYQLNDERRWHRSGTAQPFIKPSDIKGQKIFLPELSEQRRIAVILGKADGLRAKRREAIAKLDQLLQSVFFDMFGDPLTNPKSWPTELLTDICNPKQWPTISGKDLTVTGFPVYGANGVIGFYHSFNHTNPTVLVTCRGATCGTINICSPNSYVTGNAMALDNLDGRKTTLEFLAMYLKMRGFADAITGAAQPQITRQNLVPIRVAIPPIDMVRSYADVAKRLLIQRELVLQALSKLENLQLEINRRAFEGRLVSGPLEI